MNPQHVERKLIAALHEALSRGEAHGERLRRRCRRLGLAAAALVALPLYALAGAGMPSGVLWALIAAGGGFLGGLALHFNVAAAQWPILLRFLNRDAVTQARKG